MHLQSEEETKKRVVVSFKCIDINTYNVLIIDLSDGILYWHESQHLWEARVTGFLLASNYFLILSSRGMRVIGVGETPEKNYLTDDEGK